MERQHEIYIRERKLIVSVPYHIRENELTSRQDPGQGIFCSESQVSDMNLQQSKWPSSTISAVQRKQDFGMAIATAVSKGHVEPFWTKSNSGLGTSPSPLSTG